MANEIRKIGPKDFPPLLREIPDPPEELFIQGNFPVTEKYLCVVGSRKHSSYGKEACQSIIGALRGFPITIVSGLALGIDAIAHKAALDAGLATVAVPGSGLGEEVLYPATNVPLARKILERGGALLSEFPNDFRATNWSFPQRNRIMAGLSHATLIIEALKRSGTLITSRLATDYNRDVFAVPGPIFSQTSEGPNMLIRLGATPITKGEEVLEAFGFEFENPTPDTRKYDDCTDEEKKVISRLARPIERDLLILELGWPAAKANSVLMYLEIKGLIKEMGGEIRLV
ncbi:MAG: DNA-processing protein DprA [bacterium]|nr:DNA-processing protein DprA [bacterium]